MVRDERTAVGRRGVRNGVYRGIYSAIVFGLVGLNGNFPLPIGMPIMIGTVVSVFWLVRWAPIFSPAWERFARIAAAKSEALVLLRAERVASTTALASGPPPEEEG